MKMTIDEYIARCEETIQYNEKLAKNYPVYRENEGWIKATTEHKQLAEWLKELKSFKEKDEAQDVRYEGDGYADNAIVYDMAFCPSCNHGFEEDSENWQCEFCPNCGQRLRWEE